MKKKILGHQFGDSESTFANITSTKGKVIRRYNIPLAKIEYYFIPVEKLAEYAKARSMQDLKANLRLGKKM
jgi:hypothetical protein